MAAIWRLGCCKKWFVQGRSGPHHSGMTPLLMNCVPCLGPEKTFAAEFMGYFDDAKLKDATARFRFLVPSEIKKFVAIYGDRPMSEHKAPELPIGEESDGIPNVRTDVRALQPGKSRTMRKPGRIQSQAG
jgi:hypothetical protein